MPCRRAMSRLRFGSSRTSSCMRQVLGAALFTCLGALVFGQVAVPDAPSTPTESFAEQLTREVRGVIEKNQGAICRIEGTDEHGTLRGTGFLIDADGTVITSHSVGGQSEDLVVTIGEEKYPATRRGADSRSGIAVLRVEAGEPLPFIKCGRSLDLGPGSPVVALGFPFELPLSPSFGLVAGADLKFQNRYFATRHLRVNVVVQRGQ